MLLFKSMKAINYICLDSIIPFERWFNTLDSYAAAKITTAVKKMELGNFSNAESIGDGASEYKLDFGPGYRIYFARDGKEIILLLLGGTKKRQQKDIDTAKMYWQDYKKRKKVKD